MNHRLFISYSRADVAFAAQLAADLRMRGADVWIDVGDIHAGANWSDAVQQGLDKCTLMILILSPDSMVSINVKEEWQYFRDKHKPESIIPILLKPTDTHFQLNRREYIDFHVQSYDDAFDKLRQELAVATGLALTDRAPVPAAIAPIVPIKPKFTLLMLEWINIPPIQGEPFAIAKYPVTNAQFQAFINDSGYREDRYWKDLAKREAKSLAPEWSDPTCPRETVNWYEAIAFTRWLSEKTSSTITLPTETQWQWAAVGSTDLVYPYGSTFDKNKSNTLESGINKTTPVDQYPQGASAFGVVDMSGNVGEWCLNEFDMPQNTNVTGSTSRVVKGGSWSNALTSARAADRISGNPVSHSKVRGFRVVAV